ncbi:hypothetical protein D3C87_1169170 [compost metagenome]
MTAGEVAHQAAGFLDQQGACSHVPLGQARLPEGVEAAGSHVGQVQARRASAADAGSLANQGAEHAQVVVEVVHLVVTEREAGTQQGAVEAGATADAQATTVQLSAATTAGGEFFLANRVQNNSVLKTTAVFAGDADSEVRNAAQEVGGAVQRIDDPQVLFAFDAGAGVHAGLFTQDRVIRVRLAQGVDDFLFGGAIHLGYVILGVFFVDLDGIQALDGAEDQFTGAAGGAQRDIQHGLHGCVT